ncbi:hypothetical protein AQUSIP_00880 [Aquicella siphonis]|uniref:Uncharacterized protein n=1 Tax=Aquicella siphonis TaxID=254247 RepID=A0A5E4PER1_9COXI|nr:hypothetical protein [Aquicella siphonis]VVC74816.1 hypothetical protein AQUSIP_00880 [Aquicella siphonis]
MSWCSHSVREHFQSLINQLVHFHDQCGKPKNQKEFSDIRLACAAALDFVYDDEMPHGADQIVATISTGIYQTMLSIGSKKTGGADNEEFIKGLLASTRELSLFRNACEREISQKEQDSKKQKQEVQAHQSIIEPVSEPRRTALTHLDSREELDVKIRSLGPLPTQSYSCLSFFQRAVSHYPKIMAASAMTGTMGLAYIGLNLLSHYAGPVLDSLLHADETGIGHQAVVATTLLLSAGVLCSVGMVKTCQLNAAETMENDEVSEHSRLLRV